jgi:tetratricopeptide (TPR) repeat protein
MAESPAPAAEAFSSSPESKSKAQKFFDRAQKVAEAGQTDYAIEMYLQGLKLAPDDLEAHTALRKVALTRKATGGKALGMLAAGKLKRQGKDPAENFLNARKLLAHDPGNIGLMELFAKTAVKLRLNNVVTWIGPMLYRALLEQPKQDADAFIRLKDIYKGIGEYTLAAEALTQAGALRPDEGGIQHELRELAAQSTMKQGRYDSGDFRQSVRNADAQKELQERDSDIQTVDALQGQLQRARAEYEADPEVSGKIMKLVETLTKTRELKYENEALTVLDNAHKATGGARWQLLANEIKIKQFARGERMLKQMLDADPDDETAKKELADFRKEKAEMELEHFTTAAKAYPTEQKYKYEQARRLFELGRYPDAIPLLQQSQNDAKVRDDSRLLLGRAFLLADFPDEAADTLKGVIESYHGDSDDRAKNIYYWYGRACEAKKDIDEALKAYSQIAQWDFAYRDVQNRIKSLRASR